MRHLASSRPAVLGALLILATSTLTACGGGGGSGESSGGESTGGGGTGGSAPQATSYRILATNDLGMHCVDGDFSVFSILPPFNVVDGQVLRIDSTGKPSILNDSAVTLGYSAIADANGSINSSSRNKTNFWQFAQHTYGADLAPGQGLMGLYMPADASTPDQTAFSWDTGMGLFKAQGIPVIPVDDAGNVNRYPLMRLTATDKTSGRAVATLDVVLPISEETTCSDCHSTGGIAARSAGISWSSAADLEIQSRENVLSLHDSRTGTSLMATKPVLCAACHYSTALDLAGTGPSATQSGHATMSSAMHAYHSDKMLTAAGMPFPDRWLTQGESPPDSTAQTCYMCHPGKSTRCLRGAMTDSVTCQNCHGSMSSVGGMTALAAGGSIDGHNDGGSRRPWVDLPRCQSCHTGDATSHLTLADASLMASDGLRTLVAFNPADPAASPRKATASRFAENSNALFRFSKGHGGVACEGCHNSSHAIWPNPDAQHNDNVAAQQLQGHSGTITECTVCHGAGTLSASLGGPHGMHPVDDSSWNRGSHGSLAKKDRQACAACHGADFRGTPLSRTAAQRALRSRTVPRGTPIGCYDCHNGPGGG